MHRKQSGQRYVQWIMSFTAGLWLFAASALGQTHSGNIFGTVKDASGAVLPGVTVTVTGIGAPQTFVTDSKGQFRFLQLPPGSYQVQADLEGFSKVRRAADVTVGNNTEVDLDLRPSATETITVSAASPVVDRLQVASGANIEEVELQKVPSARDPWVFIQSVPSVLVDRVNVGGDKSGSQSYFVSKGVERNQAVWNINGVQTQDMTSANGSGGVGFYLDFESLKEFGVVTGSTDPSVRTPGVQMNLVTKRGENDFKGSARYLWTGKSVQADASVPAEGKLYGLQSVNSINRITETGAEAGGPIIRDRLWLWGAYSENPINVNVSAFTPDFQRTKLTNWNSKVNLQIVPSNAAMATYTYNNKTVLHRALSATRPVATSVNQSGPGWMYSAEDTQNFSSTLYLTGRVSRIHNGYQTTPVGGLDTQTVYDENGIPQNSYKFFFQKTPSSSEQIEGAKFFNAGKLTHELKFGFGYRKTPVSSGSFWPGGGVILRNDFGEVEITRPANPNYVSNYGDLYVGDTVTMGNFVVTGGLRYDRQRAKNNPTTVAANPTFPQILPGGSYAGDTRWLQWTNVSPRLGVTYALGTNKKTVAKASYARYADQLGAGAIGPQNPFYYIGVLWYYWDDLNGNGKFELNEKTDFDIAQHVNPANLGAGEVSTDRIDYGMKAPRTNEYTLGLEQEIGSQFAVGANYTYRKRTNLLWTVYEKHQGQGDLYTPADYVQVTGAFANITGTLPNGQGYSVPNYRLAPGVVRPLFTVTTNRPDYFVDYHGLELTATKRMQNHWMMRGNVTLNDWKQHVGSVAGVENGDPTLLLSGSSCGTCLGSTAYASNGGADGYINSRWSAALNSVVDLPRGFSVSGAFVAREGYIIPYWFRRNNSDGFGNKEILANGFDTQRLSNLYQLDLGAKKDFRLMAGVNFQLSADLFNVTNSHTVLWRDYRLYQLNGADLTNGSNQIRDIQSPRIWRFGARVSF